MINHRLCTLTLFSCLISYIYTAEEAKNGAGKSKQEKSNLVQPSLTKLPSEVLQEIIEFLPNNEDITAQDYFAALDSFRLTSKPNKEKIDKYVTDYIKEKNIVVPPTRTPYQAFKNYYAQTIKQAIPQRANKEEKELRESLIRQNRVNPALYELLKEAIAQLKENWLWQKIIVEVPPYPILPDIYKKAISVMMSRPKEKSILYMHLGNAIMQNKVLMVKALRSSIDPKQIITGYFFPQLRNKMKDLTNKEKFNLLDIATAAVNKLKEELKQNPTDYLLTLKLKKAKEILQILST